MSFMVLSGFGLIPVAIALGLPYCTCSQLRDREEDQRCLKALLPGTSHDKSGIRSLSDAPFTQLLDTKRNITHGGSVRRPRPPHEFLAVTAGRNCKTQRGVLLRLC